MQDRGKTAIQHSLDMAYSLLVTSNERSCALICNYCKLTWYGTTSGRWHSKTREHALHLDCQHRPGCCCQPHQLPLLLLTLRLLLQHTQHCLSSSLCCSCLQSTCCCTTGGSSCATADQQGQAGCCRWYRCWPLAVSQPPAALDPSLPTPPRPLTCTAQTQASAPTPTSAHTPANIIAQHLHALARTNMLPVTNRLVRVHEDWATAAAGMGMQQLAQTCTYPPYIDLSGNQHCVCAVSRENLHMVRRTCVLQTMRCAAVVAGPQHQQAAASAAPSAAL